RQHEMFDSHGFKSNRQKECVQMQGKWPDQTLGQAFRLPEVLVAVSTSRLSCKRAAKTHNIDAGLGFIWRTSAEEASLHRSQRGKERIQNQLLWVSPSRN